LAGVIIVDTFAALFIKMEILLWGIALAAAVAVYLLMHRSLKFLKEIFIATLYTCGILLPSLSVTREDVNLMHYLIIFHFAILALINLLLFSWFDRELDQQDRQHSFVTMVGERITTIIIWLLIIVQSLLMLMQIYNGQNDRAAILLGMMGLLFVVIIIFNRPLGKNDYYRFVGDAVFIVPILYLL